MSLENLPQSVLKKMSFRQYTVPEMIPMLYLTISMRCTKNFNMKQVHFYLLILVSVIQDAKGVVTNIALRKASGIKKQNIQYYMEFLTRNAYVERIEKRGKLSFKMTRKGYSVFNMYQRMYREEILRLRELGINFEKL